MHDSDERYPPPMCHSRTREVVILRIKDWYGYMWCSACQVQEALATIATSGSPHPFFIF
ncbi:hypothetical protein H1R20_g676, partial [Candolleomyces eurysporus]